MKLEQRNAEHLRAALRAQEKKIREILDAIELDDAGPDSLKDQIRLVEASLRRVRLAA